MYRVWWDFTYLSLLFLITIIKIIPDADEKK